MRASDALAQGFTRRQTIKRLAAIPALAATGSAAPPSERYKLGVMCSMYSSLPLDDAMSRVVKAGYRYVSLVRAHAGVAVFAPEMSKADRSAMLRRIRDLGVQPFMSLGGFAGELQTEGGFQKWIAQLDLCSDYEIPVMVGAGPWYYTKFPNVPKRERDWQEEVSRYYSGLEKA